VKASIFSIPVYGNPLIKEEARAVPHNTSCPFPALSDIPAADK